MKKDMTVLYIEDDADQRKDKMFVLSSRYLRIIEASNCEEGLNLYKEHNPDMIITDIVMGETEMNGMEMVQQIRKTDKKTPILILTAFVSNTYLLQAVNLNNVCFVNKEELVTNTHFEKVLESTEEFLEENVSSSIQELSHNIYFDFLNHTIVRDSKVISLRPKESALLKLLLKYKNKLVTFETMATHIWQTTLADYIKASIRSLVKSIRRTLGDNSPYTLIVSESGKGYRLIIK